MNHSGTVPTIKGLKRSNNQHKEDLLSDTEEIMKRIDEVSFHPKNEILIYYRYMLCKIR